MTKTSQSPVFVAVDGGSGNIAVRYTDEQGVDRFQITKSLIRRGLLQQGTQESTSTWKTADGVLYSVVDDATSMELENTCDTIYQLSPQNRVLVLDALVKAGLSGRDVVIADTLPADQFYGDNGINWERIEEKKKNIMQPIVSYTGKIQPPRVIHSVIMPEAVTAYVSATVMPDGTVNPAFEGVERCIIVDLGRFTCDIALVNNELDVMSRITTEHGVHIMVSRLHHLIQQNEKELGLNESKKLNLASMDGFIERGYIGSQAKAREAHRKDIRHLVKQAAKELADMIATDIRAVTHGFAGDIDMLLFVGGGANWLGGGLEYVGDLSQGWHDYTYIPENPERAVVDGAFLMLGQRKEHIIAELSKAVTEA